MSPRNPGAEHDLNLWLHHVNPRSPRPRAGRSSGRSGGGGGGSRGAAAASTGCLLTLLMLPWLIVAALWRRGGAA